MGRWARFGEELKRRKVIATAGVYLAGSYAIMQGVDAVFPYLPLSDPDRAGSLVLALLAVGFPIALVLSWAYAITPPRLRKETPLPDASPTTPPVNPPKPLRANAVAVLPLENLSDDPENQYFSDGITDDIISSAAHIRGIRVLSRGSVKQFRGGDRRVREIAAQLGVRTVITGSVRRRGADVRIVAEVVDGASGDVLWSGSYDRSLKDIFDVQSDVASCVAVALQRELTAADRKNIAARGTSNADAYELYLRARHLWNQRTESSVAQALRQFESAVELDPQFALAHASLAEAYTILGMYGVMPPTEAFEAAITAAELALSIDSSLGEAVAAKACVTAVFDWNWAAAEEGFERALALAPSYPTAHQWYAMNLLVPRRRFDDALSALEKAADLDPASSAISVSRGVVAFYARSYEEALGELERTRDLDPDFGMAYYFLGQCQMFMGEEARGLSSLATAVELSEASSETLAAQGHALARSGRAGEAEAILTRLEKRATHRYVSPVLMAQVLVGLGRHDEAIEQLTTAVAVRSTDLIWLDVRPHFDPIRGLDAVATILEKVDLPDCSEVPE